MASKDENRPRPGPGGRDMFVQQYVQAARERLEAINASLPPVAQTSSTNEMQTSSTENPPPQQEAILPPQAAAEYARNPSSSTQWPLKPQDQSQSQPVLKSQPQPVLKSQPESLPEAEPIRPPRNPNRPSYGYKPSNIPVRTESPTLPSSAPRGPPQANRGGPGSRGYRGQPMRYPAGRSRRPPPSGRQYYAPTNIDPRLSNAPPPQLQQYRNFPPPVSNRPSPAHHAPPQNIPMTQKEAYTSRSAYSSRMSSNTLDILNDYSDDASSDVRSLSTPVSAGDPNASPTLPASHATGIVRKASVGHVQKPVVTNIPSTTRVDKPSSADDQDTSPTVQVAAVAPTVEANARPTDTIGAGAQLANLPVIQAPVKADEPPAHVDLRTFPPSTPAAVMASPVVASSPVLASPTPSAQSPSTLNTKRSRSPLIPLDPKSPKGSPKLGLMNLESRDDLGQPETELLKALGEGDPELSWPLQASSSNSGGIRDSTTSLRGLIVRNLRLASNLEQGKTSSRFGLDWMIAESAEAKRASAGSMSSMNNAFTSNSKAEKSRSLGGEELLAPGGIDGQGQTASSRRDAHHQDGEKGRYSRRHKQCCGMKPWLFTLLLVVIVLLIAAAIIIPVALIVIPNQNQTTPTPKPTPSQADFGCGQNLQCNNGGLAQPDSMGACYCLCPNPWTGPSCSTRDSAACVSIKTPNMPIAAIGSSIGPLIEKSRSEFRINLDAWTLVGIFGGWNLTCSSENDLVSFEGLASGHAANRARSLKQEQAPSKVEAGRATKIQPRQATTNGVIYQPSTTSAGETPSPTSDGYNSETPASPRKAIDFARTATIYLLQFTNKLQTAQTARLRLERYLNTALADGTASSGNVVNIGNGWRADFTTWTVYYNGT